MTRLEFVIISPSDHTLHDLYILGPIHGLTLAICHVKRGDLVDKYVGDERSLDRRYEVWHISS